MDEPDEQYSSDEIAQRRDEAIRRALNTPPTQQKRLVGKIGAPRRGSSRRRSRPVDKSKDQP